MANCFMPLKSPQYFYSLRKLKSPIRESRQNLLMEVRRNTQEAGTAGLDDDSTFFMASIEQPIMH